jgi:hypothetical protein
MKKLLKKYELELVCFSAVALFLPMFLTVFIGLTK